MGTLKPVLAAALQSIQALIGEVGKYEAMEEKVKSLEAQLKGTSKPVVFPTETVSASSVANIEPVLPVKEPPKGMPKAPTLKDMQVDASKLQPIVHPKPGQNTQKQTFKR